MTLSEEFAQLLEELGLGDYRADGGRGGNIVLGALPQAPDLLLGVSLYGLGEADSTIDYDEPGLQVRVRGPAHDVRVAEQKAADVYRALHGLGTRGLAGGTWLQLMLCPNGGPVPMDRDANDRPEWVVNFRAEVARSTSINRR